MSLFLMKSFPVQLNGTGPSLQKDRYLTDFMKGERIKEPKVAIILEQILYSNSGSRK